MAFIFGQSSGDFAESYARIQALHIGNRTGSVAQVTPDAFTQANPVNSPGSSAVSTRLPVKAGVLSSSFAFTRPDYGNGYIGGPPKGAYLAGVRPLGFFIQDALGNPYDNTPAVASKKMAFYPTGTFGLKLWETQVQVAGGGANVGDPLVYAEGDTIYASINGLATNRYQDSYQYNYNTAYYTPFALVVGVPATGSPFLVVDNLGPI